MDDEAAGPGLLGRLAPIVFVVGLVLLGLSLLVFALAATGSDGTSVGYSEAWTVNGTTTLSYPLDVGRGAEVVTVDFRFPHDHGTAMALRCRDHEAVRAGRPPEAPEMRVEGGSGGFTLGLSPAIPLQGPPRPPPEPGDLPLDFCPFLFVVFQWPANETSGGPEVSIERDEVLLAGPPGAFAAVGGLLGALLAATGGIAWGRRLNRERAPLAAHDEESSAETLLIALDRSTAWLERTRRYVLLAGVLGLFLWYPILLPWAWSVAVQGTRASPLPWLVAAGVLALLLALTALWAREYLRLDRELVAWREKIARLRTREEALMATFDEDR